MERDQLNKINEIEERKKRKSQIKNYLKECKSANVVYPSIISSLTQNSLTDDKVFFIYDVIITLLETGINRHCSRPHFIQTAK